MNFELLSVKLNVYLNEIKKITSEVDYMLVTLNEILEEKTEKNTIYFIYQACSIISIQIQK